MLEMFALRLCRSMPILEFELDSLFAERMRNPKSWEGLTVVLLECDSVDHNNFPWKKVLNWTSVHFCRSKYSLSVATCTFVGKNDARFECRTETVKRLRSFLQCNLEFVGGYLFEKDNSNEHSTGR